MARYLISNLELVGFFILKNKYRGKMGRSLKFGVIAINVNFWFNKSIDYYGMVG